MHFRAFSKIVFILNEIFEIVFWRWCSSIYIRININKYEYEYQHLFYLFNLLELSRHSVSSSSLKLTNGE